MEDFEQNLYPELKDILNRIKAFNISNPEAVFIFSFMGWKKTDEKCEECGDNCVCPDEDQTMMGGHGDLDTLRSMSNSLRDCIEDACDKRGFVSF